MRLIGITGGIGAGKTEILSYIKKHYLCEIYLADQVAHTVKEPGQFCYQQLVSLFGESILDADRSIDKEAMATLIFENQELLGTVNNIIHPAVHNYLMERIEEARRNPQIELFFIEAALLIETGYGEILDEMWYIYASKETRRRRLEQNRGYTQDKIDHIMRQQLSEEEFQKACNFVIDNSGPLEDCYKQIDQKLEAFTWQE